MKLPFYKYHGTGNDFILINNLSDNIHLTAMQISLLCHRRFGVGADGLMLLEPARGAYDYYMTFYNSDGAEGTMCGNGGRCLVAFADRMGLKNHHFMAIDGEHRASITEKSRDHARVRLQLRNVDSVNPYGKNSYVINTGSLHLVKFVSDVQARDVATEGAYWRRHSDFGKEGINVNFAEILDSGCLFVRTFERGVEEETWACGTGSVAGALAARIHTKSPINHWTVQTKGGNLEVEFQPQGNAFEQVFLTGGAVMVFKGEVELRTSAEK
ncbi:MAG: diaminopimelate epimerase [Bacteroidales bacterium]|nr:diaminopimelate epimerase [Bacteroidales bacterium]